MPQAQPTTITQPLLLAVPLALLNGLCIAVLDTTILACTWYLSTLLSFTSEACFARAASDIEGRDKRRHARAQIPGIAARPAPECCRCSCCDLNVVVDSKARWSDGVERMLMATTALSFGSLGVWFAGMLASAEMVLGEWGIWVAVLGLVVSYAPMNAVARARCWVRYGGYFWKYLRREILADILLDEDSTVGMREEAVSTAPTRWRHLLSNDSDEELDDEADYRLRVLEPLPNGRDSLYSDALEWQDVDSDDEESEHEESEDDDTDDDESGYEDSEDEESEDGDSDDDESVGGYSDDDADEDSHDAASDDETSENEDSEEDYDDDDDSDSEWEDVQAVWEQWRSNQDTILKGLHMTGSVVTQDDRRLDRGMILRGLDVLGSVAEEDEADGRRLDRGLMLSGLEALGLESSRW